MFKKRTRPANAGTRQLGSLDSAGESPAEPGPAGEETTEEERKLGLEDIIALRRYRQMQRHEGIEAGKLTKGEKRKRRAAPADGEGAGEGGGEGEEQGVQPSGLRKREEMGDADGGPGDSIAKKLRSNNFTQQTNALDVNKHMMEYIEKELKKRRGDDGPDAAPGAPSSSQGVYDPYAQLFSVDPKYLIRSHTEAEEGGVTTSMAMLTAIPEVDLGMETRLRNIEETEKAKRQAKEKATVRKLTEEDEGLAALRFLRRTKEEQSPAIALMNARLEAQGFAPTPPTREPHHQQARTATDDQAVERFKKRMRH